MKKTLVAMAVLAASGASFAQVAITGNVSMGWAGGQDSAGNQSAGLGVDTATLDFAVSEDLGGGLKVTAHQGFDTITRGAVVGGDTGMTLGTSAYSVYLGSNQLGDYLQGGNANVSGTFNTFEGRIQGAKPNKDFAGISVPVGPVTLSVTEYEGAGTGALGLGVGSGGTAINNGARNTQYQIAYKSGALGADAAYKSYDSSTTGTTYTVKSILRGAVSYDFGVAKVGGGIAASTLTVNGTDTSAVISASMPLGAITLGAQFINRTANGTNVAGAAVTDFNQSGYGLELDYNFSKTTKLAVNYLNWQQVVNASSTLAAYSGTNSNLTEIALSKSF